MNKKTQRGIIAGAAVVVLVIVGIAVGARQLRPEENLIPTNLVKRGEVPIDVITTGEFRAPHSAMLVAPQVNGTLQIVSMLATGAKVKTGDVIVESIPASRSTTTNKRIRISARLNRDRKS